MRRKTTTVKNKVNDQAVVARECFLRPKQSSVFVSTRNKTLDCFGRKKHSLATTGIGFHLIEILITVAIVSIIAAFSIPIYSHTMVQTRRLEAENTLSKLALAMEEFHLEKNSYENATLSALHFPDTIGNRAYQLAIQQARDHDYKLAAIPLGHQAERDTACATLTLQSTGEKSVSGTGNIEECW